MAKSNDSIDFFLKVAAFRYWQKQQYKWRCKARDNKAPEEEVKAKLNQINAHISVLVRMIDEKILFGLDYITDEIISDSDYDASVVEGVIGEKKNIEYRRKNGFLDKE